MAVYLGRQTGLMTPMVEHAIFAYGPLEDLSDAHNVGIFFGTRVDFGFLMITRILTNRGLTWVPTDSK